MPLYSSTSYPEALRLGVSDAQGFFDSKAYTDHRKSREAELKLQAALIARMDVMIRAIGALSNALAKKG